MKDLNNIETLLNIMKRLRSENGCPWDKKQTFDSLKQYLLEETHEVLSAIEERDSKKHCEELGDLLLQIVFQTQIASEKGQFSFNDVVNGIIDKLIRRHPHVFGNDIAKTPEDVVKRWQDIKDKEKKRGIFDDIPNTLPALLLAEKCQKRATKLGLDFEKVEDVIEKVNEELGELIEEYKSNNRQNIEKEIGDLLFSVVNIARLLGINPEIALKGSCKRFMKRVKGVDLLLNKCKNKEDIIKDPKALDKFWEMIKKEERGSKNEKDL